MTAKQILLARSAGTYINLLSYARPTKAAVTAYRIFSSPRAGRFQENIPAFLEPVKHEPLSLDGHRLQTYRWDGKHPTVMLVHGWESNAARWEPLLPHLLESGFSVVALDAPAHGLSTGSELNLPFYAQVISECIRMFNPSFLIGHSIGGAASLLSQHVSPALGLKKMVLLGAPSDMSIILNNFHNILGLNRRSRSLLHQYFIDRFGNGIEAYTAKLHCRNISLPALVAHDLNDDVVLYDEAVKITSAWPHARLVTTRGLGHSMHDDGLYREVVNFLK